MCRGIRGRLATTDRLADPSRAEGRVTARRQARAARGRGYRPRSSCYLSMTSEVWPSCQTWVPTPWATTVTEWAPALAGVATDWRTTPVETSALKLTATLLQRAKSAPESGLVGLPSTRMATDT